MKLKNLKSLEKVNAKNLEFIVGGQASADDESRRNDSEKQDSKKHDKFELAMA